MSALLLIALPVLAADRRTPIVEAVEKATPAVVAIEVETSRDNPFFGRPGASQGSGVVIDADGIVLTNAHVVEGARSLTVRAESGATWSARVLAMEPDLDLALLAGGAGDQGEDQGRQEHRSPPGGADQVF